MRTKKIPLRMCLGCNEMKEKNSLIRVVKDPEGNVSLDPTGKKNGRGAYICKNSQCLAKAIKAKRLERTFSVTPSEEVLKSLEKEMELLGSR